MPCAAGVKKQHCIRYIWCLDGTIAGLHKIALSYAFMVIQKAEAAKVSRRIPSGSQCSRASYSATAAASVGFAPLLCRNDNMMSSTSRQRCTSGDAYHPRGFRSSLVESDPPAEQRFQGYGPKKRRNFSVSAYRNYHLRTVSTVPLENSRCRPRSAPWT